MSGYTNGDRHGWLNNLCGLLERIGHGRDATELSGQIAAGTAANYTRSAVFKLPMWMWVHPQGNAGRKGRSLDGGQLLLPIRVTWSTPTVVAVPTGTTLETAWTAVGYGRSARGTTTLTARTQASHAGTHTSTGIDTSADVPDAMTAPPLSHRRTITDLAKITADGKAAWWATALLLEPYLHKSLYRANAQIAHELDNHPGTNGRYMVLSDTTIESIADHMLLGDRSTPGSVERMLDACLRNNFARVDPMRYIKTWLRRDAEEAIRRDIGDPKPGAKVRRLAESIGTVDHDTLLAAYQQRYPNDEVGIGRITRSLNVSLDPMAERSTLDELIATRTDLDGHTHQQAMTP